MTAALVAVTVTLAAVLAAWTWRELSRLLSRIAEVEQRLTDEAERRQEVLDQSSRRARPHHTWNQTRSLEDALALMVEDVLETDAHRARQETIVAMLTSLRADPHKPQSGASHD